VDVVGRAIGDGTATCIGMLQEVSVSMDGNINTLFNSLATTIRNIAVAVGVFAFMWGAIQYATSGGSPHQLELGKSAMKASLIGVGAVVLAATLVGIVFSALGAGGTGH
jgi:type IV secretion system pilin